MKNPSNLYILEIDKGIVGIFGFGTEKKRERQELEQVVNEETTKEAKISEQTRKIVLFPGSVAEYEAFRGYKVEIVDTKRIDKGINVDELEIGDYSSPYSLDKRVIERRKTCREFIEYFLSQGVEALVNVRVVGKNVYLGDINSKKYGLPVRKKSA